MKIEKLKKLKSLYPIGTRGFACIWEECWTLGHYLIYLLWTFLSGASALGQNFLEYILMEKKDIVFNSYK